MPTFSSSSADENCLCVSAVFFFSSRYPRRVSEYSKILTHQNSLLSLLFCLFVCFILFWSSLFGALRGLPEISCVPSAQSPFLIDCVFDPETGWQLSLTAAWLNAQRSSHCGGQREKSLTSACRVPLTRIQSRRVLTALQNPTTKPNQHATTVYVKLWCAEKGLIEAGGHNDNNRLLESTADLVVASYINNNLSENHIAATQALLFFAPCGVFVVLPCRTGFIGFCRLSVHNCVWGNCFL